MAEATRYLIAGNLVLDRKDSRAFLDGAPLALSPKPFALLEALMASGQVLVSKDALFETVWQGVAVGDAVLTTAVKEVRQALGDAARSPTWIETAHGKGYRFLKPVVSADALSDDPAGDETTSNVEAALRRTETPPLEAPISEPSNSAAAPASDNPVPSIGGDRSKAMIGLGALTAITLGVFFALQSGAPSRPSEQSETSIADETDRAQLVDAQEELLTVSVPAAPAKSIAVLPFVDMSAGADQAYFSDGVAEEILNALVRVDGLRVAGRTSSFAFRGKNEDVRAIGRALNVEHVLEGSVRKQGAAVRVTAQLIQSSNGYHLWSETYDGTLDDIFDFQERIARGVAGALSALLNRDGKDDADDASGERFAKTLTGSRRAYDLFLQARALVAHRYGEDTLSNALMLLEQAVVEDPNFAEAWAEIARTAYYLPQYTMAPDADAYLAQSVAATETALALDPGLARAHLAAAGVASYRSDFHGAYEQLKAAERLDPNDSDIVGALGYHHAYLGRTGEALPLLELSVELDPINVSNLFTLGVAKLSAGELDEADRLFQRCIELGHTVVSVVRPRIAAERGDQEKAIRQFETGFSTLNESFRTGLGGDDVGALMARAFYGEDAEARARLETALKAALASPSQPRSTLLFGSLLQIQSYKPFMDAFDAAPFGGNTFTLSLIWDESAAARGLRAHPDFPAFAQRIGLVDAWRMHGWPPACAPDSNREGAGFSCR
ncbi:MAG: winged helix-turn-helix domain-containing protein [Pseudomonadota bacterium]